MLCRADLTPNCPDSVRTIGRGAVSESSHFVVLGIEPLKAPTTLQALVPARAQHWACMGKSGSTPRRIGGPPVVTTRGATHHVKWTGTDFAGALRGFPSLVRR